ncbi:MAG TPA: NHLP bacteriocin export ABC transporter permease/ATPase subunit [Ramlibacter sp.]|uniref:NHLP bacteriocin export ABC transporter permease/ATPase subunit n=1 Tax=Ramlibacter sp. TaxID=1917967 RepID=UPI002C428C44|nr:NHLP bacteriocin export ABC transporter permease/ATPase subunit [Ramlibacter sp.]HVZ43766.1 NHLP bacteriocin export ABC transporter permease/ATPase subunit [Ramlibacter sp.]
MNDTRTADSVDRGGVQRDGVSAGGAPLHAWMASRFPASVPGSRAPLALRDSASLWWVEEGTVDVFAVPAREGVAAGAREHLYRVAAGQIYFGLDLDDLGRDWLLVAVAAPATRLRELDWHSLESAAREDAIAPHDIATVVDAWVGAVTRGARKGAQPRQYIPVRPGAPQRLSPGQAFFPAERLVFVRVEGAATLLSQPLLPHTQSGMLLPLRDEAWMHAQEECTVHAMDIHDALAQHDVWAGLRRYHALVVRVSLAALERTAVREAQRTRAKAERASRYLHAGLEVFAKTLEPGSQEAFGALADEPQLAACQIVGRHMDLEFVAPPASGVDTADPMEEIAVAAGVRHRQVALRGNWWLADGGHMVGRLQESRHPVALIRRSGGYDLHDPADRSVVAVDETVAARLAPFAYTFFRSLPSRALKLADLIEFSMRSVRGDLRWLIATGALAGLLGLVMPLATGYIFDTLIPASDRPQLAQVTGMLIAVAIAGAMFALARSLAALRLESRMDAGLQAALWNRALDLPIPFFRPFSSGDLAQRLNAINTIRQALSGATFGTLLASTFALANAALLLYFDLKLGALALALVAGAAFVTIGLGLWKLRYERHMSQALGRLSGLVLEYLHGVTKLRVTGAESRAFANWAEAFGRMRRLRFASGSVRNVQEVFFSLYQVLMDMAIFGMVALLLAGAAAPPGSAAAGAATAADAASAMSTGRFIAFYGAFGQLAGAVLALCTTLLDVLNLVPVYERVKPVLQAEPEAAQGRSHPGELHGRIELASVSFRYTPDGPLALDNVSLAIRPGGFVAVVGPSGSGKSTLLRCLLGFEQPTAGGVFYDNQNLADLDARAVRRQMGVVLQHSQVMPGDIFSNIVGTTQLGIDDAWAAARFCGLEDDIRAMPMGMHTVISESGTTLSGGQRQRILIARAIVQRPRILLFDEATSALDNPTQEIVTRSLNELRATRVVIAHRLTTIMSADLIVVMDAGRIVQSGNYGQLIGQPGLFQDLARRQLV